MCPVGPPRSVTIARTVVGVERGRVGRGEIARDEHERMPGFGNARHRQAEQLGDGSVADVVEVGGALGEIAAGSLERPPMLGDRPVDRLRGALPASISALTPSISTGSRAIIDWAIEHVAARARHRRGTPLEFVGNCPECLGGTSGLGGDVRDRGCRGRERGRRGEPRDRPDRFAAAHAETV